MDMDDSNERHPSRSEDIRRTRSAGVGSVRSLCCGERPSRSGPVIRPASQAARFGYRYRRVGRTSGRSDRHGQEHHYRHDDRCAGTFPALGRTRGYPRIFLFGLQHSGDSGRQQDILESSSSGQLAEHRRSRRRSLRNPEKSFGNRLGFVGSDQGAQAKFVGEPLHGLGRTPVGSDLPPAGRRPAG